MANMLRQDTQGNGLILPSERVSKRRVSPEPPPRRRVALVHGEADAALRLKAFCEEALPAGTRVLAPAVGEACDFSVTTTSFNVRLDEALYERAAFQRCGEYEVAWVDGALAQPSAASGARVASAESCGGGHSFARAFHATRSHHPHVK